MARAAQGRENPYQPGAGARPPVLAGRETELSDAQRRLDSLLHGRPPSQGLLLFGPRGNGKTSLLRRIADIASERGLRAEYLSAGAFRDPQALASALQEKAGLRGMRITGAQAAGLGVSVEREAATEDVATLLARWIELEESPLVILVDEVHTVPAVTGHLFFDAVQAATGNRLPFWLLAAGTPDTPRRLREAGTFTERMFERMPVGRLERAATVRALSEPAYDSGLPLRTDAVALLAAKSQDYPFFVQLLGSAAWTAAENAGADAITEDSGRQGISAVAPHIARFYAERLGEARRRRVAGVLVPLAALLRDRGGHVGELEVDDVLTEIAAAQTLPGEAAWLLDTLSDLGVLWRNAAGVWEMGIPSFGDYLLSLR